MIKWLEAQGYPIPENTFVDCNHYLTHDKGYEILNIYDNKLPQIQAYQDSCQLDMPLTGVHTKMYHSKYRPFLSIFPWIEDTNFHPIIRDRINDRSLNFQTESIARDGLHRWIRRDQRVDVPTICQWNTAFDRYMRNTFCQCFPMHPLMAHHIADISIALNSQFLDYCITERRLQRECHTSIQFQTLHAAVVQQFTTFKDLSQ